MGYPAILVIDDHALFRSGVAAMLLNALGKVNIYETETLEETLDLAELEPALILLDIQLRGTGGLNGMQSLRQRWPTARIVVVSAFDAPEVIEDALGRGAAAFLSKSQRPERMVALIRQLLRESGAGIEIAPAPALHASLTPRQGEVLELLSQGLSNKMIGRKLGLSEHTVRSHVQALLTALGTSSRSQAAFAARRLGLLR